MVFFISIRSPSELLPVLGLLEQFSYVHSQDIKRTISLMSTIIAGPLSPYKFVHINLPQARFDPPIIMPENVYLNLTHTYNLSHHVITMEYFPHDNQSKDSMCDT